MPKKLSFGKKLAFKKKLKKNSKGTKKYYGRSYVA